MWFEPQSHTRSLSCLWRPVAVRQLSMRLWRYWIRRSPCRKAWSRWVGSSKAVLAWLLCRSKDQMPSTRLRSGSSRRARRSAGQRDWRRATGPLRANIRRRRVPAHLRPARHRGLLAPYYSSHGFTVLKPDEGVRLDRVFGGQLQLRPRTGRATVRTLARQGPHRLAGIEIPLRAHGRGRRLRRHGSTGAPKINSQTLSFG
jgi:hypothetical protein